MNLPCPPGSVEILSKIATTHAIKIVVSLSFLLDSTYLNAISALISTIMIKMACQSKA
jgi:hypothetical protein